MNNMKIRNKNLALFLGFKLNKIGDEFEIEDFSKLKELNINQLNDFGEYEDVDIEVLDYTPNLETLVLKNFEITDELLEKIKKIKGLKSIRFDRCIIDDFEKLRELDVEYLAITRNAFLRTDFLKGKDGYKALVLTDSDEIDMDNIDGKNIESIYITNSNVKNPEKIREFKKLRTIHIDDTDIEDISFLDDLEDLRTVSLNRDLYMSSDETVKKLRERGVNFVQRGISPITEEMGMTK